MALCALLALTTAANISTNSRVLKMFRILHKYKINVRIYGKKINIIHSKIPSILLSNKYYASFHFYWPLALEKQHFHCGINQFCSPTFCSHGAAPVAY